MAAIKEIYFDFSKFKSEGSAGSSLAVGGFRFYDGDGVVIPSGKMISEDYTIGETDNFSITCPAGKAHAYKAPGMFMTDRSQTGAIGTQCIWFADYVPTMFLKIIFKNPIKAISKIEFVPKPSDLTTVGLKTPMAVIVKSSTATIHEYKVSTSVGDNTVQIIPTPELNQKSVAIGDVLLQPETGWKRLDDKDIFDRSYDKVGDWQTGISASYHGGGYLTSRVAGVNKLKFKFKGTKFRIISCYGENRSSDARFEIDGVSYNYNLKKTDSIPKTLVFEKLELEDKIHEVVLYAGTGVANTELFLIDAIDINEDGYLIANIGAQLLQPEAGYKRLNLEDFISCVKYNDFTKYSRNYGYNGTIWWNTVNSQVSTIEFKVNSKNLRFITTMLTDSSEADIYIDGILEERINTFGPMPPSSSHPPQCKLGYEKSFDSKKIFSFKIVSKGKGYLYFDCIDIDDDGEILELDKPFPMLPQPEAGWKRSDNLDNVFNYKGDWLVSTDIAGYYNKSILESKAIDDTLSFSFSGDKLRIISEGKINHSDLIEIDLDGVKETISADKFLATENKCAVVYERADLDPGTVHKCIVTNKTNNSFIFDAVDIDSSGIILPILSRDYEFPIAVIEEEELEGYAGSLINGEEQLLITPSGSLYLTNGDRGFIECGVTKEKYNALEQRVLALENLVKQP